MGVNKKLRYQQVASEQRQLKNFLPPQELDLYFIVRCGTLAASSHNTQPWFFQIQQNAIKIIPDYTRRCPIVDPDDSHLYKSLGCAAENMVYAASASGYATEIIFNGSENTALLTFKKSSNLPVDDSLFDAIFERQSTRSHFEARFISNIDMEWLVKHSQGLKVQAVFLQDKQKITIIADLVAQGDVIQLKDYGFRQELIKWIRCNPFVALKKGDGLSTLSMQKPSLPTWLAKLLLPLVLSGKSQAKADRDLILQSPMVGAIFVDEENPPNWFEAGRLYERIALAGTARKIRNSPINQPIEVRLFRPPLQTVFANGKGTPTMLFRMGYGGLMPYSLRRPWMSVIK